MEKVFATIHQFFSGGSINGRKMAGAGFLNALLQLDPFDRYEFFVEDGKVFREELEKRTLRAVERDAIRILPRTALVGRLQNQIYHVFHLSAFRPEFPAVCALRNACAQQFFPVTAVNHTISSPYFTADFLFHLTSVFSPQDAIGTNSSAAARLIQNWQEAIRDRVEAASLSGTGPRLKTIPMGVEPESLPRPDAERRLAMRTRLGLGTESVAILLFGRFSLEDKLDPQPLLSAIMRVRLQSSSPDLHLIVSGACEPEDPALELFRRMAVVMGVPLHVLPNPSPEEKLAVYAAADIFVSPSDNIQETFGLTLLEAGAAALPAVVSDWDGYRDIIIPDQTGFLVPVLAPEDTALLDLVAPVLAVGEGQLLRAQQTAMDVPTLAKALYVLGKFPEIRRKMGEKARERVLQHFTCEAVVRHWIAFWEELNAVPVPEQERERLRLAGSLLQLPYGKLFAHYATDSFSSSLRVRCSFVGEMLLQGMLPLEAFGLFDELGLSWSILKPILEHSLQPVAASDLQKTLSGLFEKPALCDLRFYLLWALKHDLLERIV